MPRKQKQKQKQSQKQSVIVNIGEKKAARKRRPRKKKEPAEPLPPPVVLGLPKVPPIVVQYTDPASLVPPQPPAPRQEPVRQPELLAAPIQQPVMAEQRRENILQAVRRRERAAAPIRREPVRRDPFGFEIGEGERRSPLRAEPIEPQRLFASGVRPSSDILQIDPNVSFEDVVAAGERITRLPTESGRSQTEAARETRTALQLSLGTGKDVPLELLQQGRFNLSGQQRRPQPTKEQRVRLYEAGTPWRGDESGVKASGGKKKKVNV